jgi:hypothetical protein
MEQILEDINRRWIALISKDVINQMSFVAQTKCERAKLYLNRTGSVYLQGFGRI